MTGDAAGRELTPPRRPRGRLFWKYVWLFGSLVSGALVVSGLVELYSSFRESKALLVQVEHEKALGAASRIEQFLKEIERQVAWASQPPIGVPTSLEQRRFVLQHLQKGGWE